MWKLNSITEYLRKILCFQLMEGKRSHSERQDSLLLILRRPALRRNNFSKLLTIGVAVPNLTGGREIPNSSSFKLFMWVKGLTLLQFSLAILSHLRGPSGEGLQGTGEGHRLTQRQSPSHVTTEYFLPPYTSPSHYQWHIYRSAFYPVHHVHLSTQNYKTQENAVTHVKRLSKHGNQIWQEHWNYHTKNFLS